MGVGDKLEKGEGKKMVTPNFSAPVCGQSVSCEDDCTNLEEEDGGEDSEDSDEYYASIQRPAFVVGGEPNFEAGPPEDGLEYLRRVRYSSSLFLILLSMLLITLPAPPPFDSFFTLLLFHPILGGRQHRSQM